MIIYLKITIVVLCLIIIFQYGQWRKEFKLNQKLMASNNFMKKNIKWLEKRVEQLNQDNKILEKKSRNQAIRLQKKYKSKVE